MNKIYYDVRILKVRRIQQRYILSAIQEQKTPPTKSTLILNFPSSKEVVVVATEKKTEAKLSLQSVRLSRNTFSSLIKLTKSSFYISD